MPDSSEKPVQIEPLSKAEQAKQPRVDTAKIDNDPEFPAEWKGRAKQISDAADAGFRYYKRQVNNKVYMTLRKGKHDVSLGQVTDEKEGKLFHFFPYIVTSAGIPRPPPWMEGTSPQRRGFLSIPINRVAIIPRDYVPTINVIRYFQVVKENGFPGDFSQFINDIVTEHFKTCHGIVLPVLLEEEIECQSNNQ